MGYFFIFLFWNINGVCWHIYYPFIILQLLTAHILESFFPALLLWHQYLICKSCSIQLQNIPRVSLFFTTYSYRTGLSYHHLLPVLQQHSKMFLLLALLPWSFIHHTATELILLKMSQIMSFLCNFAIAPLFIQNKIQHPWHNQWAQLWPVSCYIFDLIF